MLLGCSLLLLVSVAGLLLVVIVQRTPLWPASCLLAVDKGRGSKSVEVQRVCDEVQRVGRFMISVYN